MNGFEKIANAALISIAVASVIKTSARVIKTAYFVSAASRAIKKF